ALTWVLLDREGCQELGLPSEPRRMGDLGHPRPCCVPFVAPLRSSMADRVGTFRSDAAATDAPAAPSWCVSSGPLSIGKYLSVPRRRRVGSGSSIPSNGFKLKSSRES